MNRAQLKQILPRASEETILLNSDVGLQDTQPQRSVRNESLAKKKREAKSSRRIIVSIVSYRNRLTDPDNLCGKFALDSLRYSSLLHDDREEDIVYQISQKKTLSRKEEKTLITIQYP